MVITKKIISCLIAIIIFASMCFTGRSLFSVKADTMRDISAFDLISEMKIGVNIGNSLDSVGASETSWGNPKITKQLIRTYKELGFDTIRLPVTWRTHIDSNGHPDIAWLNRVQEVVDLILEEGLYCIVNTHHEQNWLNTNSNGMSTRESKFANLWTDIAKRFKNYGDHLLFEAYNEILKAESDWSAASGIDYINANKLSQVFVDAVRATGGNNDKRILIINTYGAHREVEGFILPVDTVSSKLVVQFHSYDPGGFCFSGSKSTWVSSDGNIIDSYCRLFYENFVTKGIPVILGEFGAVDKSNEYDRAQYAKVVAQNCVKYGIKPIWWDDGGDFKLINRNNYSTTFPQIVSALIDNSSYGILPSATTYTYTTTYKTYSSTSSTTPKSTPTTTLPDIKIDTVVDVNLQVLNNIIVDISWSSVANSDFYRVYKSCNNGEFECVATVTSNSFVDYDINKSNVYMYIITACKNFADLMFESDFSDAVICDFVEKTSTTTKDVDITTTHDAVFTTQPSTSVTTSTVTTTTKHSETTSSTTVITITQPVETTTKNIPISTKPTESTTTTVLTTVKSNEITTTTQPVETTTKKPACKHELIVTRGATTATYFKDGYTGNQVCGICGGIFSQGKPIEKLNLKVPKFMLTKGKKQFKVKYTKVKDATGFQVRYKLKGKWITKTFTTKKNVKKTIKKLKKGFYQVRIRSMLKQGNKLAYSKWSKVKKIRVK